MAEPPWGSPSIITAPWPRPWPQPWPRHRKLNCNCTEDSTQLRVPLALLVERPLVHLVISLCPGTGTGTAQKVETLLYWGLYFAWGTGVQPLSASGLVPAYSYF